MLFDSQQDCRKEDFAALNDNLEVKHFLKPSFEIDNKTVREFYFIILMLGISVKSL